MEVLPLTMVNMLQRMNSKALMWDVTAALENTHINGDLDMIVRNPCQYNFSTSKGMDALVSDSDTNMDNNEHCDESHHLVE